MSTFSGKMNFLKFKNACIISIKGRTGSKKGVFIPIDDNGIFISTNEENKAKGAYIDFIAFQSQNSKYGDSHGLKLSLPKEMREKMSESELKSIPFFGNMKPFEKVNKAEVVDAPQVQVAPADDYDSDLPF